MRDMYDSFVCTNGRVNGVNCRVNARPHEAFFQVFQAGPNSKTAAGFPDKIPPTKIPPKNKKNKKCFFF